MNDIQFIIFNGMLTLIVYESWDENVLSDAVAMVDDIDRLSEVHSDNTNYPTFTIINSSPEVDEKLRQQLLALGMTENQFSFALEDYDYDVDAEPGESLVVVTSFVDTSNGAPDNYVEALDEFFFDIGFSAPYEMHFEVPWGKTAEQVKKMLTDAGMVKDACSVY